MNETSKAFVCANLNCQKELKIDHVILLTTMHMRRFCSVECITEGQIAHYENLAQEVWQEGRQGNPYLDQ
jgi:hypothetical protein